MMAEYDPMVYAAEVERLENSLEDFSWKEIQTAPKDRRILVSYCDSENVFISQWSEDVQGSGFGIVDSCCGYYEDLKPDYWMDIPKTKL